jgi:hypothetical protein
MSIVLNRVAARLRPLPRPLLYDKASMPAEYTSRPAADHHMQIPNELGAE